MSSVKKSQQNAKAIKKIGQKQPCLFYIYTWTLENKEESEFGRLFYHLLA